MSTALIGSTGFLGSNLARQFSFDYCYHSKNIAGIAGKEFDLLVCGGVTAVKWWANQNPLEDRARIDSLIAQLAAVRARRVVVLSTVDVYPVNGGVDETCDCHAAPNHAYGTNRLYFEDALRERFRDVTAVRIAGVFGPGLRKNVIYDLLHDHCLEKINPASAFQYYNARRLWRDLLRVEQAGIRLVNLVSEPIRTGDIIDRIFPRKVVERNTAEVSPTVRYDVRTVYSTQWGGPAPYLFAAEEVMKEIGEFVRTA